MGARWIGLARSCIRLVTYVYNSSVSVYLRWNRESDFAWCWVCVRVGMRPWYTVVRLMRSRCKTHVHPSVCRGVLWIWTIGVSCMRRGCATSSHVYHWRSVSCIMIIAGGWSKVKVVIVVVSVVVCDKGCKVGVIVYVKDGGRV